MPSTFSIHPHTKRARSYLGFDCISVVSRLICRGHLVQAAESVAHYVLDSALARRIQEAPSRLPPQLYMLALRTVAPWMGPNHPTHPHINAERPYTITMAASDWRSWARTMELATAKRQEREPGGCECICGHTDVEEYAQSGLRSCAAPSCAGAALAARTVPKDAVCAWAKVPSCVPPCALRLQRSAVRV